MLCAGDIQLESSFAEKNLEISTGGEHLVEYI